MARGRSALTVSRMGLPLSMVSMSAIASRFCSSRSAIRLRMLARYAADVVFQLRAAACAASSARSTSSCVERATSQRGCPVTGEGFMKYWPFTGGTYSPPIQLSYLERIGIRLLNLEAPNGSVASPPGRETAVMLASLVQVDDELS